MKEDWLDTLRTRIQNECDVKAPDGLLNDIKQEMNRRGVTPMRSTRQKASVVPLWTYRAVSAAAIIGIGIFLSHLLLDHTSLPKQCATIINNKIKNTLPSQTTITTPENYVTNSVKLAVATHQSILNPLVDNNLSGNTVYNKEEEKETTTDNNNVTETQETTSNTRQDKIENIDKQQTTKPQSRGNSERIYAANAKKNDPLSRFCIGTSYNYGTGTSHNSDKMLLPVANPYGDYDPEFSGRNIQDSPIGTKDRRTRTKHHQPIKLGVSIRYNINNRWSLQTGLNYSRLASDFSYDKRGTEYAVEQKLQYVGIPVNASYSFIKTKRFNVYATAGAEIEKLVKGEANLSTEATSQITPTHTTIKEGRPVFSTALSIGGELRISKDVSAYIEPGISHHFNNGSNVENIYKDKPTNFNLNMGVRIDLNK
ncbi:PorT family protein [Prevotella melaninogenica]|uniref:porin family protein n=1 Tax=Prevotella melaninogenica TaxID=28132 RepID=UPI001BA967A7|nr:porin family protein [Prevotella melaninogenica]QUB69796.1 PorT family protein [Prevotella melaninogenica]